MEDIVSHLDNIIKGNGSNPTISLNAEGNDVGRPKNKDQISRNRSVTDKI